MAAYKGEKYIKAQIASVLPRLGERDELIISDDCPRDSMREIVSSFNDSRIKYIEGPGRGVIKNFENALNFCSGDIIFLCDQDDVWLEGKVEKCVKALNNGAILVLHDATVTDGELNVTEDSFFSLHKSTLGFKKNILRNSYMGCCMAFRSELKDTVLPFPDKLPMHDQWIGLCAEKTGRTEMIKEPLILYRRHGDNVTGGKTTLFQKISRRVNIIRALNSRLKGKDTCGGKI